MQSDQLPMAADGAEQGSGEAPKQELSEESRSHKQGLSEDSLSLPRSEDSLPRSDTIDRIIGGDVRTFASIFGMRRSHAAKFVRQYYLRGLHLEQMLLEHSKHTVQAGPPDMDTATDGIATDVLLN